MVKCFKSWWGERELILNELFECVSVKVVARFYCVVGVVVVQLVVECVVISEDWFGGFTIQLFNYQ